MAPNSSPNAFTSLRHRSVVSDGKVNERTSASVFLSRQSPWIGSPLLVIDAANTRCPTTVTRMSILSFKGCWAITGVENSSDFVTEDGSIMDV